MYFSYAVRKKRLELYQRHDSIIFHQDFAVFPKLKSALQGIKFHDFGESNIATLNAVRSLDTDWC